MNKITILLTIVITAMSFSLGATMQSKAASQTFPGVLPFITSNDRVGFFDQTSGRVYVYDSNIKQCLFIGQIDKLGQPINVLTSNPTDTLTR